jgi:hypothetical protein
MPVTVSTNSPSKNIPALGFETQPDEERHCSVEIRDGDADVVEASHVWHGVQSRVLVGDACVDVRVGGGGRGSRPSRMSISDADRIGGQPCLASMRRSTARGAVRWKSLSRTQVGVTSMRTIESYSARTCSSNPAC